MTSTCGRPAFGVQVSLAAQTDLTFIEQFDTSIAQQYGKNMPEFAVVPDSVFDDLDVIKSWFATSYEWVGTLPPKPTKKPTKK